MDEVRNTEEESFHCLWNIGHDPIEKMDWWKQRSGSYLSGMVLRNWKEQISFIDTSTSRDPQEIFRETDDWWRDERLFCEYDGTDIWLKLDLRECILFLIYSYSWRRLNPIERMKMPVLRRPQDPDGQPAGCSLHVTCDVNLLIKSLAGTSQVQLSFQTS